MRCSSNTHEPTTKLLIVYAITIFATLTGPCAMAKDSATANAPQLLIAQTNEQTATPAPPLVTEPAPQTADNTLFYAYLQDNPAETAGPFYEFFKDKPFVKDVLIPHDPSDRKFRPMLQMRYWWNQQPHTFLPTVVFCTFVAWVFWFLMPEKLAQSQNAIRTGFWQCALTGFFCATVWMLFCRAIFLTHLGWPLGVLSTGCFQASLLVGLSVIISMIGHAFAVLLRLRHLPFLNNPAVLRVTELLIGSVFCGLILMLPSPGIMPHATMRILFLFAGLGMGALFKVLKDKPVESTSVAGNS